MPLDPTIKHLTIFQVVWIQSIDSLINNAHDRMFSKTSNFVSIQFKIVSIIILSAYSFPWKFKSILCIALINIIIIQDYFSAFFPSLNTWQFQWYHYQILIFTHKTYEKLNEMKSTKHSISSVTELLSNWLIHGFWQLFIEIVM